jgi:hypothetical protein
MPGIILKQLPGTLTSVFNTGSAFAANTQLVSATIDNTIGGAGDGYTWGRLRFKGTFSVSPNANAALLVYLLRSDDGSTFEDGSTTVTPAGLPHCIIVPRIVNTAQVISEECRLPAGKLKVLFINGAGAQINSGWTLDLLPLTTEWV